MKIGELKGRGERLISTRLVGLVVGPWYIGGDGGRRRVRRHHVFLFLVNGLVLEPFFVLNQAHHSLSLLPVTEKRIIHEAVVRVWLQIPASEPALYDCFGITTRQLCFFHDVFEAFQNYLSCMSFIRATIAIWTNGCVGRVVIAGFTGPA